MQQVRVSTLNVSVQSIESHPWMCTVHAGGNSISHEDKWVNQVTLESLPNIT